MLGSSSNTELQRFMNDMKMLDLGYSGSRFTWSNKREGEGKKYQRTARSSNNKLCMV